MFIRQTNRWKKARCLKLEKYKLKKAEWIWLDKKAESDEYGTFSDVFLLDKPEKAKIVISVAGDYNLFINGKFAGFGQYADYKNYKVCDETDVSSFLKKGENEIVVTAWYIGRSFSTNKDYGCGLCYEIIGEDGRVLSYSGKGTKASLASGYVSHRNKVITVQLGFSYEYDTRERKSEPKAAVEVEGFGKELIVRPNKKTVLGEIRKASLIDADKKLYDLGRECSGFLSVKFKAESGEKITVAFGEHIADGCVRGYIDGRDFTVGLIGNGEFVEFTGAFRRLGCRYLQIVGGMPEIEYIGVRETDYPLTIKPYGISDERRKKIYETALDTLRLCLHEHYEDCPWREQSMYIMDSRTQMLCGYYAFDNPECAESAIRLILNGQKENGLFELCFPAECSITIPGFSLEFVTMVLEYTEFSRDTALAIRALPAIEEMFGFFESRIDSTGLFKTVSEEGIWHFYEWAGALDGAFFSPDGNVKVRDEYDCLINAFLSIAYEKAADLFVLTQNFEKAFACRDRAVKLGKLIYEKFFVRETGLFKTYSDREEYSELAAALCVLAGACSGEEAEIICDKMAFGFDGWVENTLSMNIFRYALLKTNAEKYKSAILDDIDKTYGYMLDNGATSFWETIKGEADFHFAGSLCHGWSALPIYYYRILGACEKKEKPLSDAFAIRNIPSRADYAASVSAYIEKESARAEKYRNEILTLPTEKRREVLFGLLGKPLGDNWSKTKLLDRELLLSNNGVTATRYTFLLNDAISFSGILYENSGKPTTKERLIFALHGGGGTPETVGDLFVGSCNYNHMVNRVLRKGVKVFAPQLLLWNADIYGDRTDRNFIDRRFKQLGGSITAFELQCLKKTLDWFMGEGNIDTEKTGVVGLSYGGMYSLYFGATDERIDSVYSSCWFSDRRKHNWEDWVYFDAERKIFDTEAASLVFPRKLFIEVAKNDEAFPASDGEKEMRRLKKYAEESGNSDNLRFKIFDGKHELDKDDALLNEFVRTVIDD